MRNILAVAIVLAGGCREARHLCVPVIHDDAHLGPPLFEGYRFLGASADGRRVALMVTHIGPGSGQPVGGVHVVAAGASDEVLTKSYFDVTGTKEDLAKVERGLAAYAPELAAAGVEVGAHLPRPQAWCADETGTIYTAGGLALELRVTRHQCIDDAPPLAVRWQVCEKGGTRCATDGSKQCLDGQVTVRDVLRAGNVDWVVVDVLTHPFTNVAFHLFETGGMLP